MGITKKYLSNNEICRVNFTLPPGLSKTVETANVVGDFNNWDTHANPMKRRKNGHFALSLELPAGKEYQFRYLIDGNIWETDLKADELAATNFPDQYNSVLKL
jgi:1,4-alpha-glucan branching enzyme